MTNIEKFLKKIGVPSDAITKLNGDDQELNVDDIAAEFQNIQRDVLKNNPDFISSIRGEVKGTELSKIEQKIKKTFGLSAEDVKDKKFDDIISVAFDKMNKTAGAGAEELQKRLIELTNENKHLVDEIIPQKENEAKQAIKTFKRESFIQSAIAKRSLIVSPEVVKPAVQTYLESNFNVDVDDNGELVVKTKNNLNPLNNDGTKIVTFDEILDGHLASLGVIKQSNGSPTPPKPGNGTPPPPPTPGAESPKYQLAGMAKAQANAASLQTMKVFGNESK
jgi:ribosomal protein S19